MDLVRRHSVGFLYSVLKFVQWKSVYYWLGSTFVTHESKTHFNRSFILPVKKSVGKILSLFTGESLLMPLSDGHLSWAALIVLATKNSHNDFNVSNTDPFWNERILVDVDLWVLFVSKLFTCLLQMQSVQKMMQIH